MPNLIYVSLVLSLLLPKCEPTTTSDPGMKFRLTSSGISYALALGEKAVNDKMNRSTLPGIRVQFEAGPGKGQLEIRKLLLDDFQPPVYRYNLLPPSDIKWTATEGTLTLKGAMSAWYQYIFKVSVSGYFIATISNLTLTTVINLSRGSDGRLEINVPYCKSSVQAVRVRFTGGTLPKVINIFRGPIEDALEDAMKRRICKLVQTVLVERANMQIRLLPTQIKVADPFLMDYTLKGDPSVHEQMIDASIKGSITFNGEASDVPVPKMPESADSEKMMYVWISDYVAQTMSTSAQNHNILQKEFNRNNTPSIAKGLRTSCPSSTCVGTFSDILAEKYPNSYVLVDVWSSIAPNLTFSPSQSLLLLEVWCNVYVEPKREENLIMVLQVNFEAQLVPQFKQNRLCANVTVKKFELKVNQSRIGEISPLELFFVVEMIQPKLEAKLNEIFGKGIAIPVYDNIELSDPQIFVLDRAVEIGTNYRYVAKADKKYDEQAR